MKRFIKGQRGFTLIEIIIVLAILAILAALIVPELGGFLTRGHRASYDADKHVLELAVMAYWTADPIDPKWPIHGDNVGAPVDGNGDGDFWDTGDARNGMIDIKELADGGYIDGSDAVRSARRAGGAHHTATSDGSYIWYVADKDGTIKSFFWDADDTDRDGNRTEWLGDGFQGVYP